VGSCTGTRLPSGLSNSRNFPAIPPHQVLYQTTIMKQIFSDRISDVPKSFIREILKVAVAEDIISFAGGLPNRELFPTEELQKATELVFKNTGTSALQYSNSEGLPELRQFISDRYRQKFNLDIPISQILITSGSQQGLDLLGKTFLNEGDEIIIEEPGYLGAIHSKQTEIDIMKEERTLELVSYIISQDKRKNKEGLLKLSILYKNDPKTEKKILEKIKSLKNIDVVNWELIESNETYTIVVDTVPVDKLLFALARDAGINISISQNLSEEDLKVTINAVNQTLGIILQQIAILIPGISYKIMEKNTITISYEKPSNFENNRNHSTFKTEEKQNEDETEEKQITKDISLIQVH